MENSSTGKKKFWCFSIVNLLLALADGVLTFIATPDLALEANPLVAVLGFGWTALFIANTIAITIYTYLVYYTFLRYKRTLYNVSGFKQYVSMLSFNRPDKFIWTIYKFPKNKAALLACAGYMCAFPLPAARLLLVLEWTAHLTNSPFFRWYSQGIRPLVPLGRPDVWLAALLAILLGVYWLYKEYKINQKALADMGN